MDYTITEHAKQRYAERIRDREGLEIPQYVANHQEEIKNNILKMIEYGTEIYCGRSFSEYNKETVKVIINGTWVVIVDPGRSKVVTLYKIDLGLDEDFNKTYVEKMLNQFYKEKEDSDAIKIQDKETVETYENNKKANLEQIAEYKKIIKSLEEQNNSYDVLIKESKNRNDLSEMKMRGTLGILVGRKTF